jgi:hypothetical protein
MDWLVLVFTLIGGFCLRGWWDDRRRREPSICERRGFHQLLRGWCVDCTMNTDSVR